MKQRFSSALSLPAVLCLIGFLLFRAAETQSAALHALHLAAETVIPTLFPFCVLSNYLLLSGITDGWSRAVRPIATTLFGLEEEAGLPWLLGVLCGFPIGAVVTAKLYEGGRLQKESAERILALCTNVSPSFAVVIAGGTVLQSYRAGFLLWMVQILSGILAGCFLRPTIPYINSHPPQTSPKRLLFALTEAVKTAVLTMCQLAGFIVLFSVLLCLLAPLLAVPYIGTIPSALFASVLELTNGIAAFTAVPLNVLSRFLLLSVLLGFSGFCVHAQVLSFTIPLGLSARPYLCGKTLHALLAGLLSIPMFPFLSNPALTVSGIHSPACGTTEILGFALLSMLIFFFLLWKFGLGFGIISNRIRKQRRRP